MISIAVCMACHNRLPKTLECLKNLFANKLPLGVRLEVYLLDDGSSDGTSDRVSSDYPDVRLFKGDGNFFWAGGMRLVYDAAMRDGHDYYLWLNDDVSLFNDTIDRALRVCTAINRKQGSEVIVVGAMCDVSQNQTTYSGFGRAKSWLPWRLERIEPHMQEPTECVTLNGNFVLIPSKIARRIGSIPLAYGHGLADLDLGYAARRAGYSNWIMPGYAGVCAPNVGGRKKWNQRGLRLRDRFAEMQHPLGFPLWPSIVFNIRNHLSLAPVAILAPYLKLLVAHYRPLCASRQR